MKKNKMECFSLILLFQIAFISCGQDEEKKSTKQNEDATISSADNFLKDTVLDLRMVKDTLVPSALKWQVTSSSLVDDPCRNYDGFVDCLPLLMKMYIDNLDTAFGYSITVLDLIAPGFKDIGTSSGKIVFKSEEFSQAEYNFVDKNDFEVKLKTNEKYFLMISGKEGLLELKVNFENLPTQKATNSWRNFTATIFKQNNGSVTAMLSLTDLACEKDPHGPRNMILKVTKPKNAKFWQGKVMLYNPRWLDNGQGPGCLDKPTKQSQVFFYFDFAGEEQSATGALYLAPLSLDSSEELEKYQAAYFCENWPAYCTKGIGLGAKKNRLDIYKNNICITSTKTSWGDNCPSENNVVATPIFSDQSNWLLPEELKNLTYSFQ